MQIRYYGTSASEGWPALYCECEACRLARRLGGKNIRTRSQAQIDETLLIDFPPDTNCHALLYGLRLSAVRTLLITHSHHDHLWAPDICMRMPEYAEHAEGKLVVYGNDTVRAVYMQAAVSFHGIDDYVEFRTVYPGQSFVTPDGYEVLALPADHNYPERSLNYSITRDGKSILYAHDTGFFPEEYWSLLGGRHFDLVSLDCTALDRDWEKGHMGFVAVDRVIDRLKKTGSADEDTVFVISHFAHWRDYTHEKICAAEEPKGIQAAFDNCSFSI